MTKFKICFFIVFSFLVSCSHDEFEQLHMENNYELKSSKVALSSLNYDPFYNVLGSGYDVTQYYADNRSVRQPVINIQAIKDNNISLLSHLNLNGGEYRSVYSENSVGLAKSLSFKAGLDSVNLFKETVKLSASLENTSSYNFNAKKILFNFGIKHTKRKLNFNILTSNELIPFLDPLFATRINTATPQQLVQLYGTHVLSAIEVGGVIELHYSGETKSTERKESAKRALNVGVKKLFNLNVNTEYSSTDTFNSTKNQLRYQFRGGSVAISPLSQVNLDGTVSPINTGSWASGLDNDSSYVLIDFQENHHQPLIPLYEFVSDPLKKQQLKNYIDNYLVSNYVTQYHTPDPVKVYYSVPLVNHFYTVDDWITPDGYDYHGNWFKTFSYKVQGAVPIYSYYWSNGNKANHFYTHQLLSVPGYIQEGIAFYAFLTQQPNTIPIYRYYNAQNVNHLYVTSQSNIPGYTYNGVAFYAYPN